MTSTESAPTVEEVLGQLDLMASAPYGGEVIDQRAHALQAAALAEAEGGSSELVAAALLHDLGYARGVREAHRGMPHELAAATYLRPLLGDRVADLISAHVMVKRVLVTLRPEYLSLLSPASVSSLRAQGGPASTEEVAAVTAQPWWPDALRLRELDDLAKVPGAATPDVSHFALLLHRLAAAQSEAAAESS